MAMKTTTKTTTVPTARARDPRPTEVVREIRALGLRATYDREYREFSIDYRYDDPRWTEDTMYFTPYPDDAINTAREMATR